MSNQYVYNNYQQYSPVISNSSINSNTSPTFNNMNYITPPDSSNSNYSFHTPRLRYYLSKSFDIEDDLEFCPDIPEAYSNTSPTIKKFNPYTATVFSPNQEQQPLPTSQIQQPNSPSSSNNSNSNQSPRVHTPRIKKPLEIINPQTKMRIGSPAIQNK